MSMKLPAGEYFIGDPCYAVPDDDWSDILDETLFFGLFRNRKEMETDVYQDKDRQNGVFEFRGHMIAAASTKYGDGGYRSNLGDTMFSVDAGLIGAVPMDYATENTREELARLGAIVYLDDGTDIEYDNGTITIGSIEIYTGDDPYDRDEYCEEDWYNEDF